MLWWQRKSHFWKRSVGNGTDVKTLCGRKVSIFHITNTLEFWWGICKTCRKINRATQ